jgi:hypothetical protein
MGWLVILAAFWGAAIFVYFALITPEKLGIEDVALKTTSEDNFSVDARSGTSKAKVTIKTGAIKLDLHGGSDKLIEGQMVSNYASPEVSVSSSNGVTEAEIVTKNKSVAIGRGKNNLELSLNEKIPFDVNIDSGASVLDLDFSDIVLQSLDLNSGASTLDIKVGDKVKDGANMTIASGVSKITIIVPSGLGVEMKATTPLSTKDFSGFSSKGEGIYQSDGYDASSKKIKINITAGVSTIKLITK